MYAYQIAKRPWIEYKREKRQLIILPALGDVLQGKGLFQEVDGKMRSPFFSGMPQVCVRYKFSILRIGENYVINYFCYKSNRNRPVSNRRQNDVDKRCFDGN